MTRTLDSIISEIGTMDLVKTNVEGADFLVPRGGIDSLSSGKILNLFIEVHDRQRKKEMEDLLAEYGYGVRWLDPDHVLAFNQSSRN